MVNSDKWVFVINNYTPEQLTLLKQTSESEWCLGISVGIETGKKEKTPHLQGCVYTRERVGKKFLYEKWGCGKKFWLDRVKGSWSQNCKYTQKDENVLVFKDIAPEDLMQQGKRTDLQEFRQAIKRGASDAELFDNHLEILAKYPRLENRIRQSVLKAQSRDFRDVKVYVRWGAAGTGKTREPYERGAHIFNDYSDGWWDGYEQEPIILFDDFYGGIKWSFFLMLLDGYQLRLKIKGGFTYAGYHTVYITSNVHPSQWYSKAEGDGPRGMSEALERRIDLLTEFKKDGTRVDQPMKWPY